MGGIGGNDASFGAPRTLHALEGEAVASIACGALFSMAVTEKGGLFTWGWGGGGALGAPQACSTGSPSRHHRCDR